MNKKGYKVKWGYHIFTAPANYHSTCSKSSVDSKNDLEPVGSPNSHLCMYGILMEPFGLIKPPHLVGDDLMLLYFEDHFVHLESTEYAKC